MITSQDVKRQRLTNEIQFTVYHPYKRVHMSQYTKAAKTGRKV